MKSHRKELWFEIPGRRAFVNITPEVERELAASGIREGLCLVNAMHITASVFINDDESGLHEDYERWLEGLAPFDAGSDPSVRLSPQPHRRGQRRRPPQAPGDGARGGGRGDRRPARLRPLGADLLRRVRRRAPKRVLVKIIGE